jgi:L-ascorbate metabolism protein UlaG (beta-lactamase superfamily)
MEITHLGHAAVLVEAADTRILIDPGNLSDEWHGVVDLDAVLVTHMHPDHVDPEAVPALVAANPQAQILVEPEVLSAYQLPGDVHPLFVDSSLDIGGLHIATVGGLHAVIHKDLPRIGNVGIVISGEGEPTFFHPGDSLATMPHGIDVVAVPAYGPWAAMKETIDFVRAVDARHGFLIHEGLLNKRGRTLVYGRLSEMTRTEFYDTAANPTLTIS